MTFSYNVVLALFLLAPGFAAFAGLFFSSRQQGSLHSAPPPPNSILTIAFVTLAALLLHGLWASVLFLQEFAGASLRLIPLPFDPNVYVTLLTAGRAGSDGVLSGGAIAAVLLTLLLLSAIGYVATASFITSAWAERHLGSYLYGWAADVIRQVKQPGYIHVATAFVLTSIDGEDTAFGYEGMLQNMTLSSDKEITSITLAQVTAFYVKLEAGQFKRRALPRTSGIPTLYIPKEQIRNVSFTVFAVPADEASA